MELEQKPPNGPNFFLVVILFGVTIIAIFVIALLTLHWDGKHLTFRHTHAQPTSQLARPESSARLFC